MTRAKIVFDLDGTLIDSAPDIQGIANALLEDRNSDPISLSETRSFIGKGVDVFIQQMREFRQLPDDMQEPLRLAFVEKYETAFEHTRFYPNVVDVLRRLHEKHALGICTNKVIKPCHAVLDHLDIAKFFGAVVGGDSLSTRKPDPAMLHAAFDALEGTQCIYVGDSEVDAETAQRAGVQFFLFTEGYRKSPIDDIPNSGTFTDHLELLDLVDDAVKRGVVAE